MKNSSGKEVTKKAWMKKNKMKKEQSKLLKTR